MPEQLASRMDGDTIFFGALAVAAFWFCIQLCWSVAGRRWYSVAARLAGALLLLGFGVAMIFFTAFA